MYKGIAQEENWCLTLLIKNAKNGRIVASDQWQWPKKWTGFVVYVRLPIWQSTHLQEMSAHWSIFQVPIYDLLKRQVVQASCKNRQCWEIERDHKPFEGKSRLTSYTGRGLLALQDVPLSQRPVDSMCFHPLLSCLTASRPWSPIHSGTSSYSYCHSIPQAETTSWCWFCHHWRPRTVGRSTTAHN